MMTAMDHVRYLAETIGPRGSTTPEEAEAAEWHRPTDTIENVDTGAIDRVKALLWEFIREIDRVRH